MLLNAYAQNDSISSAVDHGVDNYDEQNEETQDPLEEITKYIDNFEHSSTPNETLNDSQVEQNCSPNGQNDDEIENENHENDKNIENENNVLKRKLCRFKFNLKDSKKRIKKLEEEVSSLKTFNFQLQEQLLKKTSSGNTFNSAVSSIAYIVCLISVMQRQRASIHRALIV